MIICKVKILLITRLFYYLDKIVEKNLTKYQKNLTS